MKRSNAQQVILYDDEEGHTQVYASAYTGKQIRAAIVHCVERYGRRANVRSALAEDYPPQGAERW